MHLKIIEHAVEFSHPDILNKLQDGEYAWLTQALLKTRVVSTMAENTILGLFKSELTKIFLNTKVCKWLTEHLRLMHAESLHLARFLCSKQGVRAYDILQLSRVCEIPP